MIKLFNNRKFIFTSMIIVLIIMCLFTEYALKQIYTLPKGEIENYKVYSNSIKLSIKNNNNTDYYQAFFKTKTQSKWKKVNSTNANINLQNLKSNTEYLIKTRLISNHHLAIYKSGEFSNLYKIKTNKYRLLQPRIYDTEIFDNSANFNFTKVLRADYYEVFYKFKSQTKWNFAGKITDNYIDIKGLVPNQNYLITIKAYSNSDLFLNSKYSSSYEFFTQKKSVSKPKFSIKSEKTAFNFTFQKNNNIEYYRIAIMSYTDKKYSIYNTKKNKFKISKLTPNTRYYVRIMSVVSKNSEFKNSNYTNKKLFYTKKLQLLAPTKFSSKIYLNTVTVNFNKISHADKYTIYYKGANIDKWIISKRVSTNSFFIENLKFNSTYAFRIKSMNSKNKYDNSNYSEEFSVKTSAIIIDKTLKDKRASFNKMSVKCSATGGVCVTDDKKGFITKGQATYYGNHSYDNSQKVTLLYYYPNIEASTHYSFILFETGHANGITTDGKYIYITAYRKYSSNGYYKFENQNKVYCISIDRLSQLKNSRKIIYVKNTTNTRNYRLLTLKKSNGSSFESRVLQIACKGNNTFVFNYDFNETYRFFIEGKIKNNDIIVNEKSIFGVKNAIVESDLNQDIGYSSKLGLFIIKNNIDSNDIIYSNTIFWVKKNSKKEKIKIDGKNYPFYTPTIITVNADVLKDENNKLVFYNKSIYLFRTFEFESIDENDGKFYISLNCVYCNTESEYKRKVFHSKDVLIVIK